MPAIRAARAKGKTMPQIAAEQGLSVATVQLWLRDERLNPPRTAPDVPVASQPVAEDAPTLSPLDAAVLRDGNTWAGRAKIAKDFAVPMGVVETRFHRLRATSLHAPAAPPAPRPVAVAAPAVVQFDWTPERIAEAMLSRRVGQSASEIAERFGVSQGAVVMMLRREAAKAKAASQGAE